MREILKALGLLLFVVLAIAGIFLLIVLNDFTNAFQPTYSKVELISTKDNSVIYIKSKNWGLTGDHQVTVITSNEDSEFEPDSTQEYIFNGLGAVVYRVKQDTLILYVSPKTKIPINFQSNWKIKQIETESSEKQELLVNPEYKQI
ncbi:hypothetical protein AHMF7605_02635 [Adhaeribacter arboris]|uniref:Uncharacterized protein n=1 Tax=Adhaeribacter arboris TaxID=2072846 RepID=A0A2T2YAF9_9BACT|nr:hypothetical protein [Adhaeribacter arboris]PSR52497.1 hypothetical protein AHMF7605_02635 [Adhaeribacter arboris]